MTRWTSNLWVVLLGLLVSAGLLAGHASAQQKPLKEQLVGAWLFVSSTGKLPDGSPEWTAIPEITT